MKPKDSVCSPLFSLFFSKFLPLLDPSKTYVVFRVAHDSAKEVRVWAGEVKKK
jgi:hypothetical protein